MKANSLGKLAFALSLLGVVLVTVCVVLLWIGRPNDKLFEVGKSLLPLITAVLVTTVVTVLLKSTEESRIEREKWTNRLRALVAARSTVQVARLLLSTYDVKIYFEQLPELARARSDLRQLATEVESEVNSNQDKKLRDSNQN